MTKASLTDNNKPASTTSSKIAVLFTRPLPQSQHIASYFSPVFFECLFAPQLHIKTRQPHITHDSLNNYLCASQLIVFTSQHAPDAFLQLLQSSQKKNP